MLLGWDARLRWWLIENIVAERDRWFPWAVVAFASGSLFYFALKLEPSISFAGSVFCAGMAFGFVTARASTPEKRFFCTLLMACCFGFSAAKLRTEWVSAPVVASDIGPLRMEGRIESVFVEDAHRARILFAPSMMGRETTGLPRRLRLSLRGENAVAAVAPGMQVSLVAMVRPPPNPLRPEDMISPAGPSSPALVVSASCWGRLGNSKRLGRRAGDSSLAPPSNACGGP